MPNQLIHFEAIDTGVKGEDGAPVYKQDYKIEGEDSELFCILCEVFQKNPHFAHLAQGALTFFIEHDPDTCPDCQKQMSNERKCRVCGCTDYDCRQCIEKTGESCHWVEEDLCSACVEQPVLLLLGRDF